MTSLPPRDPQKDNLLAPGNAALIIIDYQPVQISSVNSMPRERLVDNIVTVAKIAQLYGLPIVLSTVNVADGRNADTIPRLKAVLDGVTSYDRTSINAWEDKEFRDAVIATKRQRFISCALWTEACLSFASLDMLAEGYQVYAMTDSVAGTTRIANHMALHRLEQAGARMTSIPQVLCELQRDWNRTDTVEGFMDEMFASGTFPQL
ncbi:MAG: isochorismatase family protein [Bifidobacteriaceae bacterium]|jgi:nicotinamidase-related amidase|nr:isochorismatase family protein [Bifidobacteriaceae bacterium]